MAKEGQPRQQFLNEPQPKTLRVYHEDFDDIMIINADTFNSKKHTRVNDLGQKVDERGLVIEKEPIKAGEKGKQQESKAQ